MHDGCLVVYKPTGLSSHDVVSLIRKKYGVKAGHAGTLDPLAQGVLLIFLEKALKILQFFPPELLDKTYLMRVTLGRATDTYDSTGTTSFEHEGNLDFSRDRILEVLRQFVGNYDQRPPPFSAIKIGGQRAYMLARAGKPVELASRRVHVTSIRLVKDYSAGGSRQLVLRVHCSRGTYVRSLAHDIGEKLGCGAHMSYLLRERVGTWSHLGAFPAWKIEAKRQFLDSPAFVPYAGILPFSKITVLADAEARIRRGMPLEQKDISKLEVASNAPEAEAIVQVFSGAGEFLALYGPKGPEQGKGMQRLFPLRVLT